MWSAGSWRKKRSHNSELPTDELQSFLVSVHVADSFQLERGVHLSERRYLKNYTVAAF